MRIIKGRMIEMLPDAKIFLDVDGLSEGEPSDVTHVTDVTDVTASPKVKPPARAQQNPRRAHAAASARNADLRDAP